MGRGVVKAPPAVTVGVHVQTFFHKVIWNILTQDISSVFLREQNMAVIITRTKKIIINSQFMLLQLLMAKSVYFLIDFKLLQSKFRIEILL